ncbi:hypothetical protein Tco_0325663, partial [Tanacetum coccineum]
METSKLRLAGTALARLRAGTSLISRLRCDLDLGEDPEEDFKDGPVNGGDGDDDDSCDDDEEEEEASEEEEDEHLAPVDSVVDHVPSFKETGPFKIDESAATPPSPLACRTTVRIS